MKEIKGNLLACRSADALVVTTNGIVKNTHLGIPTLVMGAGIALALADTFNRAKGWEQNLDAELGELVFAKGNHVHLVKLTRKVYDPNYVKKGMFDLPRLIGEETQNIVSYPTKEHFKDPAPKWLVIRSAEELLALTVRERWTKVAMPRPGCGLGGLDWERDVKPILSVILDDRFFIVTP